MDFFRLFRGYSQRPEAVQKVSKPLTSTFKYRVIQLCHDSFVGYDLFGPRGQYDTAFWLDIHKRLTFLVGRPQLSSGHPSSLGIDTLEFLSECEDIYFLHFIEMICHTESFWSSHVSPSEFVGNINLFLEGDDLPYFLTDLLLPTPAPGTPGKAIVPPIFPINPSRVLAFPQIIRRDSEVLQQMAIEPVLQLLSASHFATANEEFLKSLIDYRNGDYEDCVAKCGSAFESVLKIICQRKGWSFKETDTADTLLTTVFGKTSLEGFYKEHIKLILTVRNRQSSAHGGGTQPKQVPKHVANYVINATAAAILLIVEETQP